MDGETFLDNLLLIPTGAKWRIDKQQFHFFATSVAISTTEKSLNRDSICFLILQTPKNIKHKMSLKGSSDRFCF